MSKLEIYTDGACRGNPGPGGWGVYFKEGKEGGAEKTLCGGAPHATNNQMELTAAIKGLEALPANSEVILYTDSTYVKNGITQWIAGWKRKGWVTAAKTPVKNRDLWMTLDALSQQHQIEWRWVKGHAGHYGNEKADQLANQGLEFR